MAPNTEFSPELKVPSSPVSSPKAFPSSSSLSSSPSSSPSSSSSSSESKAKGVWWVNGAFVIFVHSLALALPFYQVQSPHVSTLFWILMLFSTFGITAGYHRLWSHGAYAGSIPLRLILMLGGTLGFQGSIRWWVVRHRIHHRFTDTEDDPYTIKKGFFFAHIGWIFEKPHYKKMVLIDASDLDADPIVVFQHKNYVPLALAMGFVLPVVVGWFVGDVIGCFLYGGILARIACWHLTFSINSLAHWIGDREFDPKITAAGGFLVSLLTNGEGYHNFHHAYPKDYRNGIRWYDWDPTKWLIVACSYLGLATKLVKNGDDEIERSKILVLEEELQARKSQLKWGINDVDMPMMTEEEYKKLASEGRSLVQIDGYILDLESFKGSHPGGEKILKAYYGKDASAAFNGGLNFHTFAAVNYSKILRIAKLEAKKEK